MADIRQRILIDSVDNTKRGFQSAQRSATSFEATINRLKASLFGFIGISIAANLIRDFSRLSDEAIELSARLKIATDSGKDFADAYQELLNVSTRTGTSFEANVVLFTRLKIALAGAGSEAQSLALNLTQVLSDGLRLSGASAQESAGTIRQFSQAMSAGTLRGEEFNSIMENAPRLVQALTDSLGVGVGQLREMSQAGRLSAQLVTDALLEQQAALRAQAAELPITIGRAIENIKTAFTVYLTQYDEGNQKVAEFAGKVAENFETIANSVVVAGKALTLYFGASAVKRIGAYAAAVGAAAQQELAAEAKRTAAARAGQAAQMAATQANLARIAEETKAKAAQAIEEAKIATARRVALAQEKVQAAERKKIKAEEAAISKQLQEAEKAAQLQRKILAQQGVIAEKKAAAEIAVARETLHQKKLAHARAEQLLAERQQAVRLKEQIDTQKAIANQTAEVKATIAKLEARRAEILAAEKQSLTVAELTARKKAEQVATVQLTAAQQASIAAAEQAAMQDVKRAQTKLQILQLAEREGITETEAKARIEATNVAKQKSVAIDQQRVAAATAKEAAALKAAQAEQAAALADQKAAAAATASSKAKFGSATAANAAALAANKLVAAQNMATRSTQAHTLATQANSMAQTRNAAASNASAAAMLRGSTAMTAATAAAGRQGFTGMLTGLAVGIGRVGQKLAGMGAIATKASATVARSVGAIRIAVTGLVSIIGKVGSAILGWPGIAAMVAYEILKRFANIPLLFQAIGFHVEELGVKFMNLFRGAEASEAALLALREKYDKRVDQIIADQLARAQGYADEADLIAKREQEAKDAALRRDIEAEKTREELDNKLLARRQQVAEFEEAQADARNAQLEAQLANIDALTEAEVSAVARRLQHVESQAEAEEKIRAAAAVRKNELIIEAAEFELAKSQEVTELLSAGWEEQNGQQATALRERLEVQREANVELVEGIQAALADAAEAERGYLGVALDAAQRRKNIGRDFADFQANILREEGDVQAEYYDLSRQRTEANAKLREADRLKEAGEFAAASKLYDEAYGDLKNVAEGYKSVADNSEASRSMQALARSALQSTVTEAGSAATKIGEVQTRIEETALTAAEAERQRQEALRDQLTEYGAQLDELDAKISRQRQVEIEVNGREAVAAIQAVETRLAALDGRRVTTYIDVVERNVSENQAGGLIRRAMGGDIPAPAAFKRRQNKVPGSGSGDTVPAMLEPGEFIIRKAAVRKLGTAYMHQINKGKIPGFNAGGLLGDSRNDMQMAEVRRVYDELQGILEKPAKMLEDFSREHKRSGRRTIGNSSIGGSRQYREYLALKAMAAKADGVLQRLGNVDPGEFDTIQLRDLLTAVRSLLERAPQNYAGTGTALKIMQRVNSKNASANETIDRILSAVSGERVGFNRGGLVPGHGDMDKIRAKLTPGEYVLNKKTVERLGPGFLDQINRGRPLADSPAGGMAVNRPRQSGPVAPVRVELETRGAQAGAPTLSQSDLAQLATRITPHIVQAVRDSQGTGL